MAKFKNESLDLETGEHIDFDDADTIMMGYDGSELYLNSTLSGVRAVQPYHMVRYDQLTEASGTLQYQINELSTTSGIYSFLDLTDTPNSYNGYAGSRVTVNDTEDGLIFSTSIVTSGTEPPASGTGGIWYNNNNSLLYYWDEVRDKWLSVYTHSYLFTYSGNIDGLYMSIGNVVNSYAHFNMLRDATIVSVTADVDPVLSLYNNKAFEIRADGVSIYNFSLVNYTYTNEDLNVDINTGQGLQMYVSDAEQRVRDPIVVLELRWRYDI